MTGCAADADDVVQTTFQRAIERLPADDRPARPWLIKVAVNASRDVLRARRRRQYTGPWLPTPVEDLPVVELGPEAQYDARESASLAFLAALEALPPKRRAVLILRDVMDYSVEETADALEMSASNVKTTHHRARRALQTYDGGPRQVDLADAHAETISAFLAALATRDIAQVEALLAEDVRMVNDGGGVFVAALRPVHGRRKVRDFLLGVTAQVDPATAWFDIRTLNAVPCLLSDAPSTKPRTARTSVLSLALDSQGRVSSLHVLINPAKLTRVSFRSAAAGQIR